MAEMVFVLLIDKIRLLLLKQLTLFKRKGDLLEVDKFQDIVQVKLMR
jgi:hypothetical protein